jgi:hypothetical protein
MSGRYPEPPALFSGLRRILGLTGMQYRIEDLLVYVQDLGVNMVTAAAQLATLNAQVADLISDVRANNDILASKAGQLDEEGQAALDRLGALVTGFDAEIGDADKSDTATPPPAATDAL